MNATSPIIGHFTVLHLVSKPLIWSEAEGDLVVIENSILLAWEQSNLHLKHSYVCIIARSPLAALLFKGLAIKHTTVKWTIVPLQLLLLFFCLSILGPLIIKYTPTIQATTNDRQPDTNCCSYSVHQAQFLEGNSERWFPSLHYLLSL